MYRKHCFCICFIVSILSVTNGESFNDNNSPLHIPAATLSYFDEHFASLTSDLTRRVEELESRQAEDARRIDILEHMHASDVDQMMVTRRDMDVLRTENDGLENQVDTLQKQLHAQTSTTKINAATTALEYNTSDVVPHTPEVLLENISSGWTEASNATETNSKPGLKRDFYGNEKWENNVNRSSRTGTESNEYAFHAILGHTLQNPGTEQAIAFENIITMVGGHYSKNTGAFFCLQTGVYVFHWSVRASAYSGFMYTQLVRNGDVIGTSLSYLASTGSASAVVQLTVGDEVWVRVASHSSGADIELNSSMFSGYLIK